MWINRADIHQLTTFLKVNENFTPTTFAEIGSWDGRDATQIADYWNIPPQNVYIFEAHPNCYEFIKRTAPKHNVFHVAITDKTSPVSFNAAVVGKESNLGMSSLLSLKDSSNFVSEVVEVDGWAMDDIVEELKLPPIDLIKIDVEGATDLVIKGFEKNIKNTKYIQIELETKECWKGQSLHTDVINYMDALGFKVILDTKVAHDQNDTLFKNVN